LELTNLAIENGPVEIVDLPINSIVDRSSSQTVALWLCLRKAIEHGHRNSGFTHEK